MDLPRVPAEHRSIGRAFTTPDGKTYRPSMFVTLTLGSYGKVITPNKTRHVAGAGSPVHPESYDYRRAAMEALHFPKLFDRWVQNLRRCAGYRVQYFGAIEAQRRLAPHIHLAIRGAIPRAVLRQVTKATYLQLWWPPHDQLVYEGDRLPWWDEPDRAVPVPRHGDRVADVGGGPRRPRPRPGRRAGVGDAVRHPGRHPGDHRVRARRRTGRFGT